MIVGSRQSKKKKKKKEGMIGPRSLGCWSIWLRLLIRDDDTKNTRQPPNLEFSRWFVSRSLHRPPGSQIDLLRQVRNTGRADWTP